MARLGKRTIVWRLRPVRSIEREAHHLGEIEQSGESAEAVYIAMGEVALVVLPIFLVMLGLALLAYHYG